MIVTSFFLTINNLQFQCLFKNDLQYYAEEAKKEIAWIWLFLIQKYDDIFFIRFTLVNIISFSYDMAGRLGRFFLLASPEGRLSGDGVAVFCRVYFCIIWGLG